MEVFLFGVRRASSKDKKLNSDMAHDVVVTNCVKGAVDGWLNCAAQQQLAD